MNDPVGVSEKVRIFCALAFLAAAPLRAAPSNAVCVQNPEIIGAQDPNARQQAGGTGALPQALKPAQVTYSDGMLTILAENSTLSEVLFAVRAATGTNIDLPGAAASQRIWIRLGPAPARQVLRDLLDSTEFNYVIQASESDPLGIRSVSLTLRAKSPETGVQGSQVTRGMNRRGNATQIEADQAPQEETIPESTSPTTAAAPPPPPPAVDVPLPDSLPLASQLAKIQPLSPEPGTVKPLGGSPSDMIQQLQSMYEQRRQLQIQQNQKSPPAN